MTVQFPFSPLLKIYLYSEVRVGHKREGKSMRLALNFSLRRKKINQRSSASEDKYKTREWNEDGIKEYRDSKYLNLFPGDTTRAK